MNIFVLQKVKKQIMSHKNIVTLLVVSVLLIVFTTFLNSSNSEACCGGDGGCCGGGAGFGGSTSGFGGGFGCTNTNGGMGGGGNGGGWSGGSWNPPHIIPAPTATISCSPGMVDDGEPAIVEWDCGGGATSSSGEGFGTGGGLSGHLSVFPVQESTYTVTCSKETGSVKSASNSCTIGVNPPTDPEGGGQVVVDPEGGSSTSTDPEGDDNATGTATSTGGTDYTTGSSWLRCYPHSITPGESIKIKWNCNDATGSTIRDVTNTIDLYNDTQVYGQIIVQPEANNKYQLSCGSSDYVSSCNIIVSSDPSADIQASHTVVTKGSEVRITWSSIDAKNCTVTGPDFSSSEPAGTAMVIINSKSTYTITCDGDLTDSIMVDILGSWRGVLDFHSKYWYAMRILVPVV